VEQRVAALLAQMTLAEKIGQMVMADYAGLTSPDDVATYGLGALLGGGDDAPGGNTPKDWLDLTGTYRAKAAATRLGIPLVFGIDAVHGNAKVRGATVFPHDIGLGAAHDPDLVAQVESATAAEVAAMGLTMSFSPDADVGQDERWGRTYESFGEDPALVAPLVSAAVQGYESGCWNGPAALLACPKHALGAGGTAWGTGVAGGIDQGDAVLGEDVMRAVHLPPFRAAIEAGAMAIMVSYSSWNGTKMSASQHFLTDVLKGELGFRGFLLSDFDALRQLGGSPQAQAATAIGAGIDMIMLSSGATDLIANVTSLVSSGALPATRIDDAVTRILRAKVVAGIFDSPPPDAGALAGVGGPQHRDVARRAVRESMVLLKNDGARLPLTRSAHVVVAGSGADDLGIQSGGWTLGWNGVTQAAAAGITGTTILAGLTAAAASPGLVTYTPDGTHVPAGTDVGVVVLSENPYAEFEGDTDDPRFDNTGASQNPSGHVIYDGSADGVVANMESSGIPLVLLLVTGRPVRIERYLTHFDAVVAVWLPGSEGEGVADVLYGDASFVGTLPKSWPKDSTVLPISSLQSGASPLFPFGFGLRYP
jgi:beta-glucosidase